MDMDLIIKGPPLADIPNATVGEILLSRLDETPDRVLFIDYPSERSWTCSQVKDKAVKIARGLLELGLEPEDHVCVYSRNYGLTALAHIGCYAASVCMVGCFWTNVHREVKYFVEDAECKAIICCAKNFDTAQKVADEIDFVKGIIVTDMDNCPAFTNAGKRILTYTGLDDLKAALSSQIPCPIKGPLDKVAAAIFFSSGTTGKPKAIIRSHRNMVASFSREENAFGQQGETILCHNPLVHSGGTFTIQTAIARRCTLVFIEEFEPETFLQVVEKYKVPSNVLAPSRAVMLFRSGLLDKYDHSSLKRLVLVGAAVPEVLKKEVIKALKLDNWRQFYGCSETGLVTYTPINGENPNTIGKVASGVEVKIVDPATGRSLGANELGECYVRGPEVSPSYYKNPKARDENFTSDGWFKTGDALYYDENQWFFIVDRYKEIIKCDGIQVSPAELESILMNHPAVAEAAVLGIPQDVHGQLPKAFVVLKKETQISDKDQLIKDLIKFCDSQVGEDVKKLKGGLEFIDSLPKIGMGKIDRQTLKKMMGLAKNS